MRGFAFRARRPRQRVILRRGVALGERFLDEHVDHAAVLGVHADGAAVLPRAAHGAEDARIVEHEHAGVGHEQLERGHPLLDHCVHLDLDLLRQLGDDHVEAVVDGRLALGLLHPRFPRVMERLSFVLNREVDDGGGAAESGGDGAGFEIVGGGGAAERHVHVRVHVDAAWEHVLAPGVDDLVGRHGQRRPDGRDFLAIDEHVSGVLIRCGDDRAVFDQDAHFPPTISPR
jgi:hypothetical protein